MLFLWRYAHYPASYPRVEEPIVQFFFVGSEIMDLVYPFVYASVDKKEKAREKTKAK